MADGLTGPTVASPIRFVAGRGFMAWCGDAALTTDEFRDRCARHAGGGPDRWPCRSVGRTQDDCCVDGWNLLNPLPVADRPRTDRPGGRRGERVLGIRPGGGSTSAFRNETLGMAVP